MKSAPILIIDKNGLIGERLSLKLSKEFLIVLASKKFYNYEKKNKNIIHISYAKKFPEIPDNKYSHIVIIDEGGLNLEFLPKIIDKVRNINAEFIFASELSPKAEHLVNKILGKYPISKTVLYGDIFDNELILKENNFKSAVNKFIYQAQQFGKIHVHGDGLRSAYPVFIDDVVNGLIDLVFGIHGSHSLFYIFPRHPITELSLAHMIQKANPQVGIDFINKDPRKEDIVYPAHGKYLLDNKYEIASKIRKVDIGRPIKPQGKEKRFPMFPIWMLFFLIFSPAVFTLLFAFFGLSTLYFAKTSIDKGNFANTRSSLHLSQTLFSVGKNTSDILFFQGKLIGREQNLKRLIDDIDLGNKTSSGLLQAFNAEPYFTKVLKGTSKNPVEDFTKGQNHLRSAVVAFEKLRAEEKTPILFKERLKNIDPLIKLVSETVDVMPSLFGLEGEKIYMVLFQNNMELRPGGGFIGSYGILKLNMGKITDFSIHDVYDADGQLRGHVEPPFAIRRHLPSVHWYLRDSNFDVDFVKSASSSSNFLNIETGQKVSGVVGIDVSFVKNILHAIGPVDVADYKEKVSENNLYMLTQAHSEKNFFPGSTQKKDFLRSLYKAILAKIPSEDISYPLLAQALSDSLLQKHLLFGLNNKLQNIFTVNGWSSSLWDERKENKESINDFMGINEANLGVNKANYFIKRKLSQKIKIEPDGGLFGQLDISYKNTSVSWPGGAYKNYLRIILPIDADVSSISINDIPQILTDAVLDPLIYEAKKFIAPKGLEVEKTNQEKKTSFGFLVNVPVGELVTVKIEYNVPKKTSFDLNNFSYSLKLFKQPGVDNLPYLLSLDYPDNLDVIKVSDGIKKEDGKLSYSETLPGDKEIFASFASK